MKAMDGFTKIQKKRPGGSLGFWLNEEQKEDSRYG